MIFNLAEIKLCVFCFNCQAPNQFLANITHHKVIASAGCYSMTAEQELNSMCSSTHSPHNIVNVSDVQQEEGLVEVMRMNLLAQLT